MPAFQQVKSISRLHEDVPTQLFAANVRGGDCILGSINGVLSKDNLSTLFAGTALANGLVLVLSPDAAFQLYGGTIEKESLGGFFAELLGSVNIGLAATAVLLAQKPEVSLAKAVGLGLLPRLLVGTKSLITGKIGRIGFKSKVKRVAGKLSFAALIIASLLLEKGMPDVTLKIIAGVETLVGLLITLSPEKVVKTADIDVTSDDYKIAKTMLGCLGQALASHGLYVACLAAGCTPVKALGVASVSVAVNQLYTVATKRNEDLGMPQSPFVGYAIFTAGIAAKLLCGE